MIRRLVGPLLLALAFALTPGAGHAILYIDINAPGGKRMPVALPDLVVVGADPSLSAAIPKVGSDDLRMTAPLAGLPPPPCLATARHPPASALTPWWGVGGRALGGRPPRSPLGGGRDKEIYIVGLDGQDV